MNDASIDYRETRSLRLDGVLELYRANGWSAAQNPQALQRALEGSHALVSAWHGGRLVGLGNAISDGHLVVFYPHLVVLPEYQRRGIGRRIFEIVSERYRGFHQQVLLADRDAIDFYEKCGFERAGETVPMWIFQGTEH